MTYFKQLQETLDDDYHHRVPFICNPPELEMEVKVNGMNERHEVFTQSVDRHLSTIQPYQCRICDVELPYHITVRHLHYSSGCNDDNPYELLLDCIYGCCESCSDKIANSEINSDGSPIKELDGHDGSVPPHILQKIEEQEDIHTSSYNRFIPYLD